MILLDFNQIFIAGAAVAYGARRRAEALDPGLADEPIENLLREMTLNSIRYNRVKFTREFGELVLATDASRSWRVEAFEHYKSRRRSRPEESSRGIDWAEVGRVLGVVRSEIASRLPYPVIEVSGAEADDAIAVLAVEAAKRREPTMVVSGDKDFRQLQSLPGVRQYSPMKKEEIVCADPAADLREHVIRGDATDGIPNALSDGDCFVTPGKRQVKLTARRLEAAMSGAEPAPFFERNEELIDLRFVPWKIREEVKASYSAQKADGRENRDVMSYLFESGARSLLSRVGDF